MKKRIVSVVLLLSSFAQGSTKTGIVITPQTSSAVLAGYTQVINTAGLLDYTFGYGLGFDRYQIPNSTDAAVHGVAVQTDGKLVVAGAATIATVNTFTIVRYNVDGDLDASFGNGTGYVTTVVGTDDVATGVVLQPDGKIVAGGYVTLAGRQQFAAIRYNSNGTLDTTFNAAGTIPGVATTILVANRDSSANGITLQSDGKIVLGGRTVTGEAGNPTRFGLVRYNANGTIDTTFGALGIVVTPSMGGADDTGYAVTLQADGKIVLVGKSLNGIYRAAVARYLTDGTLDTATFGGGLGYVVTNIPFIATFALSVVIQADQKIVVGGYGILAVNTFVLARYTTAGVLDPSFGAGVGYVTTPIIVNGVVGIEGQINSLLMQLDGKIVAGGQITFAGLQEFALARYNLDGSLDTTFGSAATGYLATDIDGAASAVGAIALDSNGKLIAVGKSATRFAIARYINPFTLASFTASYGGVGLL